MNKETNHIPSTADLLAYFYGELDENERQEVENYLNASEKNRQNYRRICRMAWWIRWSKKEQQIDEVKAYKRLLQKRPRTLLSRWYSVAAIALLLLSLAGGILWLEQPQQAEQQAQVISPIQSKARLILSSGKEIDLNLTASVLEEKNGSLLQCDSTGKISYQHTKASRQELIFNKIITPRGGEYQVTLTDGTQIWLNAESRLEYPVEFIAETREVKLQGEAYFSVSPDAKKPFIVRIGNYRLQVYGTEFNLNSYDTTEITTVLVEGSVAFTPKAGEQEVYLKPNQRGTTNLQTGETEIQDVDVYPYIAWKNNDMVFVNERLESIMLKVARWYDVEVTFEQEELKELRFYGDMKRYAEIRELLNYLEATSKVRFIQNGRNIRIQKKQTPKQ